MTPSSQEWESPEKPGRFIAVVEDNPIFLRHYKKWLGDIFHTELVDGFPDGGDSTLQGLLGGEYRLVVLDIALSDRPLGGLDLADAIENHKGWGRQKPAVIVLSGSINPNDVSMIERAGPSLVTSKPLTIDQMRQVLEGCEGIKTMMSNQISTEAQGEHHRPLVLAAVQTPSTRQGEVAGAAHGRLCVILDAPAGHNVIRGSSAKGLGPKPLRILKHLIDRAPSTVPFDDLFACAGWTGQSRPRTGISRDDLRRRLDQHIRTIRLLLPELYSPKEMDLLPAEQRLACHSGLGYAWRHE